MSKVNKVYIGEYQNGSFYIMDFDSTSSTRVNTVNFMKEYYSDVNYRIVTFDRVTYQ